MMEGETCSMSKILGQTVLWVHRANSRLRLTELSLAVVGAALLEIGLAAAQPTPRPLAPNDVSILFPAPKKADDLANLIALSDLQGPSGAPQAGRLWSETDFRRFLAIAEDPAVQVAGQ